jgi:hypothetical protein
MSTIATTRIVQFLALPVVKAHPAPSAMAGHHHNGVERVQMLAPAYLR